MTKQVGFQRLKALSVLGPRPAWSLAVARSYPAESCSSTWPCLLCAGDDLHAPHCAADKEEDGTDSCVDCWPHSEGKVQCKSKKKKRKGHNLCGNQVSEQTESLAVFAERSELFDRLGVFSTGNERRRLRARGEHVGPLLAVTSHVPNPRRVVLSVWRHARRQCTPVTVDG